MALIATPVNYLDRTRNKIVGGSILFDHSSTIGNGQVVQSTQTRFIDTRGLDISAFVPSKNYDSTNRISFSLIATFTNGNVVVLWNVVANATGVGVGYMVPKKVYDMFDYGYNNNNLSYCSKIELVSSSPRTSSDYINNINHDSKFLTNESTCAEIITTTTSYYFTLWKVNSTIVVSQYLSPNIILSATDVKCSYNDVAGSYSNASYPTTPFVISDSLIRITNEVSDTLTSNISWYLSSTTNVRNSIDGINVLYASNVEYNHNMIAYINVTSNIYYNGPLFVTAENPDGLQSQKSFTLRMASIPRINTSNVSYSLTTQDTRFQISSIQSTGSGPLTWDVRSSNTQRSYSNILSVNSTGYATLLNSYIYDNITVTASNINNVASYPSSGMATLVSSPIMKTPQTLIATIDHSTPYTYDKIHQIVNTVGPNIRWFHKVDTTAAIGQSNNIAINSNTGILTIQPHTYINGYVTFGVSNVLGSISQKKVLARIVPQPYFTSPSIISALLDGSEFNYTFALEKDHGFRTRWSIRPAVTTSVVPSSIQLNSMTGVLTILDDAYIANVSYIVTAKNIIPGLSDEEAGMYSRSVVISVANTPSIITTSDISGSNISSMLYNNVLVPLYQPIQNTGDITWGIVQQPGVPGVADLSIVNKTNSNASLLVRNNHPVDANITVFTSNALNGYSNISFYLRVSQIPIIVTPSTLFSNIQYTKSYTFPMSTITSNTNIKWYIQRDTQPSVPSTVTINSTTGLLSISSNTAINQSIVVAASNIYGESNSTSPFTISVSPIPEFVCPSVIYGSITNEVFNYTFNSISTDIQQWSVYNSSQRSIPNMSITSTDEGGKLTLASNVVSFKSPVTILASNTNRYVTMKQSYLDLLVAPNITQILTPLRYNLTDTDYTYQMELTNTDVFTRLNSNITWSVMNSTSNQIAGLTINSNTGLLRFQNNSNYNDTITVKASTDAKYMGYSDTSFNINITQSPILIQPNPSNITQNLSRGEEFTYQIIQIVNGVGNLEWSIIPYDIPGLTISTNGALQLGSNYAINCNLSIVASNTAGGYGSVQLELHVAHTPIIQGSNLIKASVASNEIFQYTFNQIEQGTGTLFAKIISSPVESPNVLSFSSNGVLTVASNNFLSTASLGSPITVQLSNMTGGLCNFSFDLLLRQNPSFTLPSYLCNLRIPNTTDYTYQVQHDMTGYGYDGNKNWSIGTMSTIDDSTLASLTPLPGLTISSSGLISLASNTYLNCNVAVAVSNDANGTFLASTDMVIAYNTILNNPVKVAYNFSSNTNNKFMYDIQYNSNVGTGPLRWSITDENSVPIDYLSMTQFSGSGSGSDTGANTLTYGDGVSYVPTINKQVTVEASNIFNTVSTVTFPLVITKTPKVNNPSILLGSMQGTNDYTYTFVENTLSEIHDIVWYIIDNPFTESLSINPNTGTLRFLHENKINADITVAASNANAVSCNITLRINIAQTPQLITPLQSTTYHNFNSNDSPYTFQISSNYSTSITGPLSWKIGNSSFGSINALSINNSGTVTFRPPAYLNDDVYVLAYNENGGSNIIHFRTIFANQPNIKKQDDVYAIVSSSQPYYLQYSNIWQVPGEDIRWTYSPQIPGLSISNSGLLTLQPNYIINCNITVTASNVLDYNSNISSYISVFNPPNIVSPDYSAINRSVNVFSNYQIPVTNTELRSGTLNWSYTSKFPASTTLSINASSGVLTLQSPYSLSNEITVIASTESVNGNVYSSSNTFFAYILRDPLIQAPVYSTFTYFDTTREMFAYSFIQSNIVVNETGPITWMLNSSNDRSSEYLSISSTGVFQYSGTTSGVSINKDVNVIAVNSYNASNVVTVPIKITGTPLISSNNITITPASTRLNVYYSSTDVSYVDYINISNITTTTNCNISTSTSTFPYALTGLLPNNNYNLRITPVNFLGSNGSYISSNVATLASPMSNLTVTTRTSNIIGLLWSNTTYSFLQLQTYDTLSSITCNTYIPTDCNQSYNITQLNPNRLYNLTVTPYNSNTVAGISSSVSALTLSDFGRTFPTFDVTSSNILVTVYPSSSNYNNIAVTWSNVSINTTTSNTLLYYSPEQYTYNIRNLYDNTPYSISLTTYNNAGEIGTSSNAIVTTKSTFNTALSIVSQGNYIYDLIWGIGKFAYVKVMITKIRALQSGATQETTYELANNVTETGLYSIELNPDYYKYIFTVISYDSSGNIGQQQSVTHYLI